ncbi:MAG: SAM-dependent methyltransferase [Flavobacteriaceae bacterium]|nr:MAG: SAM-dependent methyltransferase [Flavobacteriaceae bacterium]
MQDKYSEYFKTNEKTWDLKVPVHAASEFYEVERFKHGQSSLNPIELKELGAVSGKKLLHLQCHFGLDTLSWSRLGAKCTGIDISSKGIEKAIEISKTLNLPATFIQSNVYDVPKNVQGEFDIVFTSYGVIGWLPDLNLWAKVIEEKLKPGGVFYMVEFHPIMWMFDYTSGNPELKYAYDQKDVIYEEYKGTYADSKAAIISKEYGWNHGLGEVITALTTVGLNVEFLHEFDEAPYDVFPEMEKTEQGQYVLPLEKRLHPLLYSIKAVKKA